MIYKYNACLEKGSAVPNPFLGTYCPIYSLKLVCVVFLLLSEGTWGDTPATRPQCPWGGPGRPWWGSAACPLTPDSSDPQAPNHRVQNPEWISFENSFLQSDY